MTRVRSVWIATGSVGVAMGIVVVLLGVGLPWVTIFNGEESVNGVNGDGAYLAASGIGAAGLWMAYLLTGRPRHLRALTVLAGFLITYWAFFDTWRIASLVANRYGTTTLGAPVLGPGPIVAGAGGLLLLVAALPVPAQPGGLRRDGWLRLGTASALFATGAIHLQQAPHHLELSTAFGLGFVAAAVSQLLLGVVVLVRGHRLVYALVIADCALFFGIYAYAVFHGLPFPAHDDPGLTLGAGETVTLSGALSKLFEVIAINVAVVLMVRRPGRSAAV